MAKSLPENLVHANLAKTQFLNRFHEVPARCDIDQAGWYLGFSNEEISILMSANLLRPLGHPPINGRKFFNILELDALRRKPGWLDEASDAIVKYWRLKNSRKTASASGRMAKI